MTSKKIPIVKFESKVSQQSLKATSKQNVWKGSRKVKLKQKESRKVKSESEFWKLPLKVSLKRKSDSKVLK